MQITIDLPQDLEQDLICQAAQANVSLQTLILKTLRQLPQSNSNASHWSETVLSFEGSINFPAFESCRRELLPKQEPF